MMLPSSGRSYIKYSVQTYKLLVERQEQQTMR
jgi:hypothetical protein